MPQIGLMPLPAMRLARWPTISLSSSTSFLAQRSLRSRSRTTGQTMPTMMRSLALLWRRSVTTRQLTRALWVCLIPALASGAKTGQTSTRRFASARSKNRLTLLCASCGPSRRNVRPKRRLMMKTKRKSFCG